MRSYWKGIGIAAKRRTIQSVFSRDGPSARLCIQFPVVISKHIHRSATQIDSAGCTYMEVCVCVATKKKMKS